MLALPAGTELWIQNEREANAKGVLQSVEAAQLSIVKDGRVFPIGRDRISRVEVRKPDALWNGMVIGLLGSIVAHAAYGTSWSKRETIWNYTGSIGVSTLLDLGHHAKRTVYRARD